MKKPILVLALMGCAMAAQAWTGSGTAIDPYKIATETDLEQLCNAVNSTAPQDYDGYYFVLTNDIALTKQWTPIGTKTAFKGFFDGKNHSVSNVQVDSQEKYAGFFAQVQGGSISNLRIASGSISGDSIVGGVVGYAKDATIDNCANTATVQGKCQVGGVVGSAFNAQVKRSFNIGAVSSQYEPKGYNFYAVGGVVGYVGDASVINSCYNTGGITSKGDKFYTGGVIGEMSNANARCCYNIGLVAGKRAGAVLGTQTNCTLDSCYADAQLCPNLPAMANTAVVFANVKTVPTKELTAMGKFGLFVENHDANRYSYYSENIDNDPLVRVSVAALTLADGDKITAVGNDFTVGDASLWRCSNHKVKFGNSNASVDLCQDGTDATTLTATAGNYSRQIALKIANRCATYTKDQTTPDTKTLCASELPYTFSDKNATEITAVDFDFASLQYSITRDLTFATVDGCDSVVTYTITCYPLPTATLSDDIDPNQKVLKGGSLQVVYKLDGAANNFSFETSDGTPYNRTNPIFSRTLSGIDSDQDFTLTNLTCATDDGHVCTANADDIDVVHITVVDEVDITINTTGQGTMTDFNPTVKADGTAEKIYSIVPADGWYLSKLENNLDEEEVENVYVEGGKLRYAFTPTKDTKLTATFARVEAWDGNARKPFMTRNRDSVFIYTTQELAWVAQQFATTSTPNPAPALVPYTRTSVDWTTATVVLADDLDCGGVCNSNYSWSGTTWDPIGTETNPFTATFDGQNHEIKNLYINAPTANYQGLFGKIGSTAELKNFAVTFGSVSGNDYVGCVVGYNDGGKISHCYNMAEITKANQYVGGIAGYNAGTIEYAYNVGLLLELDKYGGGITGYNAAAGTVQNVYSAADAWKGKVNGALVGKNEGTFANAYWDNQMSSTVNGDGATLSNTVVSKPTSEMPDIFASDATNWVTTAGLYPQLKGLDGTNAAYASVAPVLLIQKADGRWENAHAVQHDFNFDIQNSVTWSTPSDNWLDINGNSAKILYEDCYGTDVFVVAKLGNEIKRAKVNIRLDGDFSATYIDTKTDTACSVADINYISGVKPTGGNSATYVYRWLYTIGNDPTEIELVVDTTFSREEREYLPKVTEPGTYHFYREAKDNACEQNYVRSDGTWTLVLLPPFEAGAIGKLPEMALCNAADIPELQDSIAATGGDGNISYRWLMDGGEIATATAANYTPTAEQLADNQPHTFVRQAKDGKCNDWKNSENSFVVTLLADFDAGAIKKLPETILCNASEIPALQDSISASGGDGNISYRWLMDGVEIAGATVTNYTPTAEQLADHVQHTFVRQAKDGKCSDWENSENSFVVTLLPEFTPGAIKKLGSLELCPNAAIPTLQDSIAATGGDGNISYRWLMDGEEIASATAANYTPTAEQLADNQAHTFVRQAKDGKCNDWLNSENSVTITLLAAFDAGAIKSVTDELLCLDGDQTTLLAESETAATGGDGNYTYRWTLSFYDQAKESLGTATVENNAATLNYEFDKAEQLAAASYPIFVTIAREAKDGRCHDSWEKSSNTASYIIAQNEAIGTTISVCERDFPYTYEYAYNAPSKGVKQITFDNPNDVQTIDDDETAWGCLRTVTITAKATPTPTVAIVDSLLEICEGESGNLFIEIEPLSGNPTKYKLLFDDKAFVSVTEYTDIPADRIIPIKAVGTPQPRIYTASLQFLGGTQSCESEAHRLEISISLDGYLHQKWNDVIVVNNSGTLEGKPLTFVAYQWYRDGQKVEKATLQHIYEPDGLSSVYYALLTAADGTRYRTCDFYTVKKEEKQNIGIKVYPVPVRPNEAFVVALDFADELLTGGTLEIRNAQGVKLFETTSVTNETTVNQTLAQGFYLVRFVDAAGEEHAAKFIVK